MNRPSLLPSGVWTKLPPLGLLALAAFVLCAGTGVALGLVYRPDAPLDSLALLLMKNPAGVFVRSAHYWSAQLFLVFSFLHIFDHLVKRSEGAISHGVWLRLTLTIPVILYAMLSGFLLRAAPASTQAGQIFRTLLHQVPGVGGFLAWALAGTNQTVQVLFLHHACTATVLIWLVTVEHSRRITPGWQALGWVSPLVLLLATVLVPGLESGPVAFEKGPWYLAGLQELLHWALSPRWVIAVALLGLLGMAWLPKLPTQSGAMVKRALAAGTVMYAALSLIGLGFRGEGWRFGWALQIGNAAPPFRSFKTYAAPAPALVQVRVPTVNGQREGCLSCHSEMAGLGSAHDPQRIGCAACHLGERFTLNRDLAHAKMTRTPGNLSVVHSTCAQANCHSEIEPRVRASLMNTLSGLVAVDKYVFGETQDLNARFEAGRLGHSPADTHLRTLCVSCHLGQDKAEPAPLGELSRGGGCSACHVDYSPPATEELRRRQRPQTGGQSPRHHPAISVNVPGTACFGCHSRSGRIALNYEGWQETLPGETPPKRGTLPPAASRTLADGRVVEKHAADVHFDKGLECIDCHVAAEIMGEGLAHAHKEGALKIACLDCHSAQTPAAVAWEQLDPETQKIITLRKLNEPGREFVRAQSGAAAYPNLYLGTNAQLVLQTKRLGRVLQPKPLSAACGATLPGHRQLECRACHSAWAPQCITCHTSFDAAGQGWDHLAQRYVNGAWEEKAGDFLAEPPVLGIEQIPLPTGKVQSRIAAFVPGMILSLDKGPASAGRRQEFHRLFAPVSPHTVVTRARDCRSCHANPAALGYGHGKLTYEIKQTNGVWKFDPSFPLSPQDGLPLDAWVGFLQEPRSGAATRTNCRPLNLQEQHRILLVGACLECHSEQEPRLGPVFTDFEHFRTRISPQCRLPY